MNEPEQMCARCRKPKYMHKRAKEKGPFAWTYSTEIPHATFEIIEEGEKFCRGIVFDINDLP